MQPSETAPASRAADAVPWSSPPPSVELRSTAELAHRRDDEDPVGEATRFEVAEETSSASSSSPVRRMEWILEPHDGGAGLGPKRRTAHYFMEQLPSVCYVRLALKGLGSSHANEGECASPASGQRALRTVTHRHADGESYRICAHTAPELKPSARQSRRPAPPNINPHPPSRSPGNFDDRHWGKSAIAGIIARPKSELRRRAGVCLRSGSRRTDSTVEGAEQSRGRPRLPRRADLVDVVAGFRLLGEFFDEVVVDRLA
jgi:hypothetical protein